MTSTIGKLSARMYVFTLVRMYKLHTKTATVLVKLTKQEFGIEYVFLILPFCLTSEPKNK
mgnify:CR=1 FL=1